MKAILWVNFDNNFMEIFMDNFQAFVRNSLCIVIRYCKTTKFAIHYADYGTKKLFSLLENFIILCVFSFFVFSPFLVDVRLPNDL